MNPPLRPEAAGRRSILQILVDSFIRIASAVRNEAELTLMKMLPSCFKSLWNRQSGALPRHYPYILFFHCRSLFWRVQACRSAPPHPESFSGRAKNTQSAVAWRGRSSCRRVGQKGHFSCHQFRDEKSSELRVRYQPLFLLPLPVLPPSWLVWFPSKFQSLALTALLFVSSAETEAKKYQTARSRSIVGRERERDIPQEMDP